MRKTPRASPLEEKLETAMTVFWEKGYYDTSIEDLMERTGLHRAAIYGGYGSKKKFFEMLLRRYRATYITSFFVPLETPEASLAQIEAFFRQFQDLKGPPARLGCLMCVTSSEVSQQIRSVERIVSDWLDDLRSLIRTACANALKRKEVRPATDPDLVADYAVGAVLGTWAMIRSPMPRDAVVRYLDGVLTYLQNLRPVKGGGR
jgi:TetR/AcrR family transcriptional repressor of nem operon